MMAPNLGVKAHFLCIHWFPRPQPSPKAGLRTPCILASSAMAPVSHQLAPTPESRLSKVFHPRLQTQSVPWDSEGGDSGERSGPSGKPHPQSGPSGVI